MSKIINNYPAKSVMEGAGVQINRVFGYHETKEFDPFLMLDYFNSPAVSDSPGFPWHPHKGIETITYILEGSIEHEDSLGNKDIIRSEELQWMTAGKGIVHQEMPGTEGGNNHGFQFWLNLPAKDKYCEPAYRDIKQGEMKVVNENGATIRIISGQYHGLSGVIDKENLGVTMLHISLNKDSANFNIERDKDKQGFIFVFQGNGLLNGDTVKERNAYTLSPGKIEITCQNNDILEFIYVEGRPLKEPIAWYGPMVMNSQEEIKIALREFAENKYLNE